MMVSLLQSICPPSLAYNVEESHVILAIYFWPVKLRTLALPESDNEFRGVSHYQGTRLGRLRPEHPDIYARWYCSK